MKSKSSNGRGSWANRRLEFAPTRIRHVAEVGGSVLTESFHLLGLFAIGAATVWSAVLAYVRMVQHGSASVEDLLLLFIYLEVGAMVGIYFKTNRLPVRFLIYVAMTALTRHLIGAINPPEGAVPTAAHPLELNTLVLTGAITMLAFAVLVLRYGSHHFPSEAHPAFETDLKAKKDGSATTTTTSDE
jgi:protein PsiE